MPRTTISPLVHSPEEHSIVAMPDNQSVTKIAAIQQQLKSLLGEAIWTTPPHALHMTLMEVICDTEYKDFSRKEHFTKWHKRYNTTTRDVIAQFQPIDVTLS